jgi:hypothetical protein
MTDAWAKVGEYWHQTILPKHFTREGDREYGYAPRTRAYMIRKARKFGHQDPLVFSGELKREAFRICDVRNTSKGAKVVLHVPAYTTQTGRRNSGPNKEMELMDISVGDADRLAKFMEGIIDSAVQSADQQNRFSHYSDATDITQGHRDAA